MYVFYEIQSRFLQAIGCLFIAILLSFWGAHVFPNPEGFNIELYHFIAYGLGTLLGFVVFGRFPSQSAVPSALKSCSNGSRHQPVCPALCLPAVLSTLVSVADKCPTELYATPCA